MKFLQSDEATVILSLLVFVAIGTTAVAYAEEVQFPTLTTDGLVDYKLDTFYPTNQTYIVQISLLYEVEDPIEIPNEVTWFDLEGTAHIVRLQDGMNLSYYPTTEEVIVENQPIYTEEDLDKILENQREEDKVQNDDAFGKLRQCLAEFKEISDETGDQKYYAWQRIADLQEFDIPEEWVNANDYNKAELEAQKKWTICEALKKYRGVGAFEANKGLDEEDIPFGLDTTDSPDTIEVTDEMIKAEADIAEKFSCTAQGKSQGLCRDYLAGDEYTKPEPTLQSSYGQYQDQKNAPLDFEAEIKKSESIQCKMFYPLYNNTNAVELPAWLQHCESSQ